MFDDLVVFFLYEGVGTGGYGVENTGAWFQVFGYEVELACL